VLVQVGEELSGLVGRGRADQYALTRGHRHKGPPTEKRRGAYARSSGDDPYGSQWSSRHMQMPHIACLPIRFGAATDADVVSFSWLRMSYSP